MLRFLLFLLLPGLLHAHQIAEIPMSLQMAGGKIRGSIAADAAYMLPEFRGDEDEEARDPPGSARSVRTAGGGSKSKRRSTGRSA